jgi:hypothetical protein
MAVFQVMPVSAEIQRIIMRGGSAIEIAEQAYIKACATPTAGLPGSTGLTSLEKMASLTKNHDYGGVAIQQPRRCQRQDREVSHS